MKTRPVVLFAALTMAVSLYSQERGLKTITLEESQKHMKYLSSDALEGRRTGSAGNEAAAQYISSQALSIGLKPLPGRKDLFQTLDYIMVSTVSEQSGITVKDTLGNITGTAPVSPLMAPDDSIRLSGEVVFAGYGYTNGESKYNDFAGVPVTDRIVMIMTRIPDLKGSGMPASPSINEGDEFRKLPMLMMQKARAILFVADPALDGGDSVSIMSMGSPYTLVPLFKQQGFRFNLNAFAISRQEADMILRKAGVTLAQMQDSIASSRKPASFIVPDTRLEVRIGVKKDTVTSSNVVGYIEGKDPVLKQECIIYTAHYDHVGIDASGNVFNGANDNASGAVGLLNVAEAFTSMGKRPLRSVVFLWTTGEEEGLHGSEYYVANPLFPLDRTVADINFDMIARSRRDTDKGATLGGSVDITGPDTIKIVSAGESTEFINLIRQSCDKSGLVSLYDGKGTHFNGSDHFPFYKKGIPAVFFFTGLHRDYHKPTDDYEFVDFDKLVNVSKAGFITGYKLTMMPERLVIDKPAKQAFLP